MSYEERLKKLLKNNDPFWFTTIDNFVKATYEDKEQGISDLEILARDNTKFNEFTKQIIQRKDDLKKVKEEFIISQNDNIDIEDISKKIVVAIQNLNDDVETSISALLDKKIDSKTMFSIYNLTIEKLKEVGLYLNFAEHENQIVGLPFNIPFKKGYIKHITISERIYNDQHGKESIISEVAKFSLAGKNANIKSYIEFCNDEKAKDKAVLEFSIPFVMTQEEILKLNEVLNEISINYQPYDKDNTKVSVIPEYFNHADVSINNINYSIKSDNEILSTLKGLIKYNLTTEAIAKAYDILLNNCENKKQ